MPVPDYQSAMLPLLRFMGDSLEHSLAEAVEVLSSHFQLTDAEKTELLPSGQGLVFPNRIGWACSYMKKACLIQSTRRSHYTITERGRIVLKQSPPAINVKFLQQYPEFVEFRTKSNRSAKDQLVSATEADSQTPEEAMESAHQTLRNDLATEILHQIMQCSPTFFEEIVVDLLVRMGYGGSRKDAGQAVGKSGDGGIDGIIKEDRLGLDVIFIQAKRWEGAVGRPEIQKFVGALQGQRAKKGIFITTSTFTREALDYAAMIDSKVVLMDGERVANFMIDFNVGVSSVRVYEVKRIDSDYFTGG